MAATDDLDAFHTCLKRYTQTQDPAERADLAKRGMSHYEAAITAEPHSAIFPRKYTIDSVLGVGTATYVFKVRTEDGYPSTLKVLKRPVRDDSLVAAFRQELEKLRSDDFKNVARVFEIFTDPGSHVGFTMAYAEGNSLEQKRTVKPPTDASDDVLDKYYLDVAKLALQIAEGICDLHCKSILHLDLRPGNVIQGADGRVTIVDCQCLALQLAMVSLDGPEALAAVLPFVAPEVLERSAQYHSDVHSFGKLIVFIMEGRADANAAHDALQELADRAPRLAVMLRAAIDSSPGQRPQDFQQIVAGLKGAVESLENRIAERRKAPVLITDWLGLAIELGQKFLSGELKRESTLGMAASGVVTVLFFAALLDKHLSEFAKEDFAACMLVIFSYVVLGPTYFFNISSKVRFWGQPGRERLRFFMSFWYVLPIVVALLRPQWWAFCAFAGMTLVAVFNWSLWSYLKTQPKMSPRYFPERRVAHQFMVKFIYFVNAVFGSAALLAIGSVLVWMRHHRVCTDCGNSKEFLSLYWIEIGLALLVMGVNLAVWWTAVRANAIAGLGLITGMELEYEIRNWTSTHPETRV